MFHIGVDIGGTFTELATNVGLARPELLARTGPRNASGKVIKKQLAAQLAEQLAGTRSPSAPART